MDGGAERAARSAPRPGDAPAALPPDKQEFTRPDGILMRRARLDDIPGIAGIMAGYVAQGVLLPRPVSELYQCVREFHVAERPGVNGAPAEIVACAALRLLWRKAYPAVHSARLPHKRPMPLRDGRRLPLFRLAPPLCEPA